LTRLAIKRMATEERSLIRDGALYTSLFTGIFAYSQYRLHKQKSFLRSHAHYKLN
jgi:hypothetical protein